MILRNARYNDEIHIIIIVIITIIIVLGVIADPTGRAVSGVGLLPLACWHCGFESRQGHGCLSLVSVVYCQVEVSAMS